MHPLFYERRIYMAEKSPKEYIQESFQNFYTVLKTKFVRINDIVKTCTSTSDNLPLAASQGKILNDKISKLEANNVLWSNETGSILAEGSTINLSDKISAQKHGIILVFALRNASTNKANSNYQTLFFPKTLVGSRTSYDISGIDWEGSIFAKHMYISDQEISTVVNSDNSNACKCNSYSGSVSGINGNWVSSKYVLRFVIGV